MPCSKEDYLKKYEDAGHLCEWQSYQQLLKKYKEASLKGDIERKAELKDELQNICRLCGAFPIPEIMRILEDVELPESEVNYIRNSIPFIKRCADDGDFKTVDVLVADINQRTGCNCETCEHHENPDFGEAMVRGFSNIQGNVSPTAAPSLEEDAREKTYPETCTDGCKFVTCPYRRQENYNLPCKQQWRPLRRSLDPDNMEE